MVLAFFVSVLIVLKFVGEYVKKMVSKGLIMRSSADHIAHIEVFYDGTYEKHQVVPECDVPEGVLSDAEIDVLNRIYEKFKNFGSVEISDY